jgi:phosphoenolpyruvate-protein phosphotransferase (PTS system enzyme I)
MTELRLRGRPASPGFASGPIVVLGSLDPPSRKPSGDPTIEAKALLDAVAGALADTLALQVRVDGEASDMVAFQAAMLADPELVRPASTAIADGTPADFAWVAAMDAEIAGYMAAEDSYFRARTVDLQDVRDRVLAKLARWRRRDNVAWLYHCRDRLAVVALPADRLEPGRRCPTDAG